MRPTRPLLRVCGHARAGRGHWRSRLRRRRKRRGAGRRPFDPASGAIRRDPANAGKGLTIGSKNFSESIILAEIYGQALEAGGFTVRRDLDLGLEQITTRAMREGRIDGYPEYTGTALSVVLGVPIREVPSDPDQAFELSRRLYGEKLGFAVFARTPFEDANAVGILPARAAQIGDTRKISTSSPRTGGCRSPPRPSASGARTARRPGGGLRLRFAARSRSTSRCATRSSRRSRRPDHPFTTDGRITATA
jgi:hypothetical protein